jgi:ribosomal protein L7/L12
VGIGWIVVGAVVLLLVVALARGGVAPLAPATPAERGQLEFELQRALAERRKIDAIKLYRALHGIGLKDAKEAVERMLAENPARPIG